MFIVTDYAALMGKCKSSMHRLGLSQMYNLSNCGHLNGPLDDVKYQNLKL